MILKGNQRSGGTQLATHLMNIRDNDHVTVHDLRGFVADDLHGAFKEAYAISRGTRCKQYLFSLSLSPPETESVGSKAFEDAIAAIEEMMGIANQPRAIIFHEKNGRRHAHCVWSRIDVETMTAINLSHYKLKLRDISRQLYLDNDWKMPSGLANSEERNPLNFSREEWQQAMRARVNPRKIKEAFQDCWAMSDGLKAFRGAMEARGYYLAQGDRRGFVALDWRGEIYSVSRYADLKSKDLTAKLGSPSDLPTVSNVKQKLSTQVSQRVSDFKDDIQKQFEQGRLGLKAKRDALVVRQRDERLKQFKEHEMRHIIETKQRAQKFRKGLRGLWDWVSGRRKELTRQNELELSRCQKRDEDERQSLVDELCPKVGDGLIRRRVEVA